MTVRLGQNVIENQNKYQCIHLFYSGNVVFESNHYYMEGLYKHGSYNGIYGMTEEWRMKKEGEGEEIRMKNVEKRREREVKGK